MRRDRDTAACSIGVLLCPVPCNHLRYWIHCIEAGLQNVAAYSVVPSRRLDDQIRDLCSQICAAPENEQEHLLDELQSAIRRKIDLLRKLAARNLLHGKGRTERRAVPNGHP